MSVADVVTFVSVGIIGGAIIQYPLGYFSDRWDRRMVLLITTACAMLAALALVFLAGSQPLRQFPARVRLRLLRHAAVFAVGRARQRPRRQGRVRAGQRRADAVLFVRRHRSGRSPLPSSCRASARSRCSCSAPVVYAVFIVIILYRMQARAGVPAGRRGRFIALLRTSTIFARLARSSAADETRTSADRHGAARRA